MRDRIRYCGATRGFVLLTVLSVVTGCLAIGAVAVSATRLSLQETQNRIAFLRAIWLAEECAERARAALYEASPGMPSAVTAWSRFDQVARESSLLTSRRSCAITLVAGGDRIDITRADSELLRNALHSLGITASGVDPLVDALLDWQDADTMTRRFGAETSWYKSQSRVLPRNGPLAHFDELRLVRGYDDTIGIGALFDVENGRLSLTHTPRAVLAVVPGIGSEIADAIVERRQRGGITREVPELFGEISAASRISYLEHQESLISKITVEPDSWILTSSAAATGSSVVVVLELKLARSGSSAVVVRRRARWT